jgi:phosphoenolpyruvate carboxykinase (ATP)
MSINLKDLGFLHDHKQVLTNAAKAVLIENSVRYHDCKLTPEGSVVMYSGKHTGRSPKDKYVVHSPKTDKTIDWSNNVHKMTAENFTAIKKDIIHHVNKSNHLYVQLRNVGAVEASSLAVELYTPSASHALFFDHLMRADNFNSEKKGYGTYRIFHAPTLLVDMKKYGTRSETVIAINIDAKEIIIAGTLYAGEIKKAVFSVMNYILPEHSLLPMHSGANRGSQGDVSVFFGLSGTGKTTLSTQEGRLIIGDDEHGLSHEGVFNFEGGCYAKMYKISAESEPLIYKAANRFGAFLENVVLDKDNKPQYDDKSIAENTRSSYPLNYLDNIAADSKGKIPNHIFFLSADAFGVLPPMSKLTRSQAMYYFLSGYTAKLAGTEVGVQEPSATFSTCFGAPFMMRPALEYADLLGKFIDKYKINVWLINTGWSGGVYGVGKRFSLSVTRRLIDAIQKGEMDNAEFAAEEIFGLNIPKNVKDVKAELLVPRNSWSDSDAYKQTAIKLAKMFHENFKKFPNTSAEIQKGGPIVNG